jgi:hypothetical protein
MELGIEHGGWVAEEAFSADRSTAQKYHLREIPGANMGREIERNVVEADGTVIFRRGPLDENLKLAADLAAAHGKPLLQVDLNPVHALEAARGLYAWLVEARVRVLNVAGPPSSQAAGIYNDVYQTLWGLFTLDVMGARHGPDGNTFRLEDMARRIAERPGTLDEALALLERHLALEDRVRLARADAATLSAMQREMGPWVGEIFGLEDGNTELVAALEDWRGQPLGEAGEAGRLILEALAGRLRKTHRLRIVGPASR